jgi:hypothetical protein
MQFRVDFSALHQAPFVLTSILTNIFTRKSNWVSMMSRLLPARDLAGGRYKYIEQQYNAQDRQALFDEY